MQVGRYKGLCLLYKQSTVGIFSFLVQFTFGLARLVCTLEIGIYRTKSQRDKDFDKLSKIDLQV